MLVYWGIGSSSIKWPNRAMAEAPLKCACKRTDCYTVQSLDKAGSSSSALPGCFLMRVEARAAPYSSPGAKSS